MARPMRSKVRAFGRFSSREIVDCEHSSRSDGDKSSAILNIGSLRRELASCPSSYPAAIISKRKRRMSARLCVIRSGARGSTMQAASRSAAKALLDLAQQQNAAIGREQTAIEFGDDGLAGNRGQAGQRQHRIVHGGGGLRKW